MSTTHNMEAFIKEAMLIENTNKYKFDVIGTPSTGDGYSSDIYYVKVTAYLQHGKEKIYDMVVKAGKNIEGLRENSPFQKFYLREIQVYSKVFPAIKELQEEYSIGNAFTCYAKCYCVYHRNNREAVMLQDIKALGYVLHDRTIPHNLEHILCVLRTYAKWHGASLALKTKKPQVYREVSRNMTDILRELMDVSHFSILFRKYFEKALNVLRKYGKEDDAIKIKNAVGDIVEILGKMTINHDSEAATEAVFLHGDCWNNNMMFKYDDSEASKPTDMVLLDFQVTRIASPILDLSYYLYSVADKSTLNKFEYFLEEYHKGLTNYLHQYSINADEILSLKRLKTSWKKYGRYGLGLSPFIIRTQLCEANECVDFTQKMGEGSVDKLEIEDIAREEEFERRVCDVFIHFAETFL